METCGGSGTRILGVVGVVLVAALFCFCRGATAGPVGMCYGTDGDNLPTPVQAVALLQKLGVTHARIFDSNAASITAFADSGIDLSITVDNSDLTVIAFSQNSSDGWVTANVLPYVPATNISSISVGSEVAFAPSSNLSAFLVPAMRNIYTSLKNNNLASQILVTTSNAMNVLSQSYPPSSGTFDPTIATTVITPLLEFLSQTRAPFLLNSYPYYAYVDDPQGISLAYALFTTNAGVVDSGNNLQYTNLLDAQIDAVFAAMSRLKFTGIPIVVAETGWPSKGDANETAASVKNAETYNQNLINHIDGGQGTPLMPDLTVQTYIFSLFNEDEKPGAGSERNFGVYYPTSQPVYSLNFGGGAVPGSPNPPANRTWCVADNSASNNSLAIGINWACSTGGVDCDPIQTGGVCYSPDTFVNHADWAFNAYYQASNKDPRSCNFSNTAELTQRDPSYGNCIFFASSTQSLWQVFQVHQQAQFSLTILLSLFLVLKLRD